MNIDHLTSAYNSEIVMVPVHKEIVSRLREYLESIDDTETTYSAIIANWIDKQIIADRQAQAHER
jgi:hypothetical protein